MKNIFKDTSYPFMAVLGIAILVILVGGYYIFKPATPPKTDVPAPTETATISPSISPAASSTNTAEQLKEYKNTALGLSFSYPRDFFIKSEQFTKEGVWQLVLHADRGDMMVTVAPGPVAPDDTTRLNSKSVDIGSRQGSIYDTRRDVCDATVAQTQFDSDTTIGFSFVACSEKYGSIYNDRQTINSILSSVRFSNENTRLFVTTKYGFAFRYPITWTRPSEYSSDKTTGALIRFGSSFFVHTGNLLNQASRRPMTVAQAAEASLKASTTDEVIKLGGKDARLLTFTPVSGTTERTVYAENKNSTDLIILNQRAVDPQGFLTVTSSFFYLK